MRSICLMILTSVLLSATNSFSQVKLDGYEIGVNVGTLVYQGDLSAGMVGNYKALKPSVGVYVARSVNDYFKLRASIVRGRLSANEADYTTPEWRKDRAYSFTTPVTELSMSLVFHPYGTRQEFRRLTPYAFAGAGVSIVNVKRNYSNINTAVFDEKSATIIGLGIDTLHTPSKVLPVIPIGAGIHYSLTNKIGLRAEAVYRYTSSDYLDGFKHSVNPDKKDSYYGVSVGLSFLLGKDKYACPTISRY